MANLDHAYSTPTIRKHRTLPIWYTQIRILRLCKHCYTRDSFSPRIRHMILTEKSRKVESCQKSRKVDTISRSRTSHRCPSNKRGKLPRSRNERTMTSLQSLHSRAGILGPQAGRKSKLDLRRPHAILVADDIRQIADVRPAWSRYFGDQTFLDLRPKHCNCSVED